MHIRGQLRLRLRLSKPHRLSHLQRSSRRLDLLQPGNPINPYRIRHHTGIPPGLAHSPTPAARPASTSSNQPFCASTTSSSAGTGITVTAHASNATDRHRHFSLTHSKHSVVCHSGVRSLARRRYHCHPAVCHPVPTISAQFLAGIVLFVSDRLALGRPRGTGFGGALIQGVPPLIALVAAAT